MIGNHFRHSTPVTPDVSTLHISSANTDDNKHQSVTYFIHTYISLGVDSSLYQLPCLHNILYFNIYNTVAAIMTKRPIPQSF